ncbi:MAG: hypothetical protein ACYCSP_03695 [Acidobacteriaceae bacterium]
MNTIKTSTSSAALAASERSGEAVNAAGAAPLALQPLVPDSEVVARPRRRRFTAEYKRSILDQAESAQDAGAGPGCYGTAGGARSSAHSERFSDKAPAEVYATLIDEGQKRCLGQEWSPVEKKGLESIA